MLNALNTCGMNEEVSYSVRGCHVQGILGGRNIHFMETLWEQIGAEDWGVILDQ